MKKKPAKKTKRELLRIHALACRQMNEDVEPKHESKSERLVYGRGPNCSACHQPFTEHLGSSGTCLKLQDALQQLAHIYSLVAKVLYAHNPGKDCPRCRLLHKDIAQLSRRDA